MAQTILETPCYLFEVYRCQGDKHVNLIHKPSKRGVVLTSDETALFLNHHAKWQDHMEPHYLAGMLWEAHAAPILAEIDMTGNK